MSDTADNYLFLGLPGSGKTTYFSIMAQHLQNTTNRTKNMKFMFLPTEIRDKESGKIVKLEENTSEFIADCISRLKKQRWPLKTQGYDVGYSFELIRYLSLFGKPMLQQFCYRRAIIDYHDYPGEAFTAAFGEEDSTSDMNNIANDIKRRIKSAKGLFLILDAVALFNGTDSEMQLLSLTTMFRYIKNHNPNIKLAIIFNKLELFYGELPNLITILRKDYGNVYANLPLNHKFFHVYPLGSVETGDKGEIKPPKVIVPKDILEPVKWMIGF